ncbi:MAG: helicase-related protein, partial [Candidatus Eiseniibacteriota bacterium]
MQLAPSPPRIVAVLGPTNTGKTHFAIERMLGHRSGMIGFPLRLLARENYDRVVKLKGARAVALVTGEEKIVPPGASYFLCTVESMPVDRKVEFLAVDEIQLAADPERGHVFTDRLLHARGEFETMFVGAETIKRLIRRLVPDAEFMSRPRLSQLSYSGAKRITRLPRRSAVIGFSAAEVYELAELMRRRRGGTAVVLGALSPRTRNAQVAMYQEGEVDYMVATDAIGMGLNMDIDHVAFSGVVKFDGRHHRRLGAAEIAQIAGRAGRHMNDGTFGTTGELEGLDLELIDAVENHRFQPLKTLFWRNSDLDFRSLDALQASLDAPPPSWDLMRAREADDQRALATLARQEEIAALASTPDSVRLLWEVCQIPDFRKMLSEAHTRLLARVYGHLVGPAGRLPADWVARQVDRIDRTDGDIDTLIGRIAGIRTWTYVSHRGDWLDDAGHWQERARAIEDRLSDALHERLTQRFVDRRSTKLVRRLDDGEDLLAAVTRTGDVLVEGEFVGRVEGFRFVPDATEGDDDARALLTVASRALRDDMAARVRRFVDEPDKAFELAPDGTLLWRGVAVGRLAAGRHPLSPVVDIPRHDQLEAEQREQVRRRLGSWVIAELRRRLGPLVAAQDAMLSGPARGLVYQLAEALGALPRRQVASLIVALKPADRRALAALGVKLGEHSVFMPALQRPAAMRLRALLWCVHNMQPATSFEPRRGVIAAPTDQLRGLAAACGYRPMRGLAIRVDRLEKLATEARRLARVGPFGVTPGLAGLIDGEVTDIETLLTAIGYRKHIDLSGVTFVPEGRRRASRRGTVAEAVHS